MILHHFLSIFLIFFAYSLNFWTIGIFIILIHDFSDLFNSVARILLVILFKILGFSGRNQGSDKSYSRDIPNYLDNFKERGIPTMFYLPYLYSIQLRSFQHERNDIRSFQISDLLCSCNAFLPRSFSFSNQLELDQLLLREN